MINLIISDSVGKEPTRDPAQPPNSLERPWPRTPPPCRMPIYHYVIIRATKANIFGFLPNSNMQDYTWNPNEWWVKKG